MNDGGWAEVAGFFRHASIALLLTTLAGCGVRERIVGLVPDNPERARVLDSEEFELPRQEAPAGFKPPNPDRQNPFQFPQEQVVANEQQSEAAPKLLGFVNVDGPRAILRVGGVVNPYREGQECGEFTLVKVEPPSITLRRGDLQWSASLFGREQENNREKHAVDQAER